MRRNEIKESHSDSRDLGLHHSFNVLSNLMNESVSVTWRDICRLVAVFELFHFRHEFAQL